MRVDSLTVVPSGYQMPKASPVSSGLAPDLCRIILSAAAESHLVGLRYQVYSAMGLSIAIAYSVYRLRQNSLAYLICCLVTRTPRLAMHIILCCSWTSADSQSCPLLGLRAHCVSPVDSEQKP